MTKQIVSAIAIFTVLTPVPALAQSNPLRGTWSGHWLPESGGRDAVSVRFSNEGERVVGEMINPESVEFVQVSFDDQELTVVAEAESSETGAIRIDARIEEETRLNGTIMLGDDRGEIRLTKWTFLPRPR